MASLPTLRCSLASAIASAESARRAVSQWDASAGIGTGSVDDVRRADLRCALAYRAQAVADGDAATVRALDADIAQWRAMGVAC